MKLTVTVTVILTFFCALFLFCCRWDDRTITYRVESAASAARIEYHDEYEDKIYKSSVKLPWEKTFNIQFRSREYYGGGARKENYTAYISADLLSSASFPVKASIYVDGNLMRSESTTAANHRAAAYYLVRYCD